MKTLKTLFVLLLCAVLWAACDDDNHRVANPAVQTAFDEMFPGISRVDWDREQGYYVAEFRESGREKSVWFDLNGVWMLTETDVPVSELPQAILASIQSGEYAGWRIEDVDYIERRDMEPVYVVDMELGEQDVDLHYSVDGHLLQAVTGNGDQPMQPDVLTDNIKQAVQAKYPSAKILDIDREAGYVEVEVWYDNTYFDMILDSDCNWVQSVYEIFWQEVPDAVKAAFAADGCAFYARGDGIEMIKRPGADGMDVTSYRIELDREPRDIVLYYTEEGGKAEI